ncbi:peptide chain release factor N(5)-glutamine methyltransferase [Enterovirga sp. CN4-39]|uniref:peptide chain release factor N(5)-glutamine methyltransferase n=1 Tax=Enterovirga sp. CN4-39 TaxID=3400910 RepID=UPI003C01E77F
MDREPHIPHLAIEAGTTRAAAQAELRRALTEAGIDSAALDARLLTAAALGVGATSLLADPQLPLGEEGSARLADMAARRLAREPVARILGRAEFWGLPFSLSPETLAPRPDTETIVEAALDSARRRGRPGRILDLGTGSGCILVALLSELKDDFGIGLDRSPGALLTARRNAEMNGVADRAAFVASDWASAIEGRFALIVSNPPYIRAADILTLEPEVSHFDPARALDGGKSGLEAYRAILDDAGRLLERDGLIVLELGHDQAESVAVLAEERGFAVEAIRRDLGGHQRAMTLFAGPALVSRG